MGNQTVTKWEAEQYQLLDFGGGRKLERFGSVVLDRLCPAADEQPQAKPALWSSADLVLDGSTTAQQMRRSPPRAHHSAWQATFAGLIFKLKVTPFGHVGLFPEQAENWRSLGLWVKRRTELGDQTRALNLFAYTGGSTLALAQAGASVVHVDASAPAVNWARDNASLSGLAECPVRWIVEDARKFVGRELRRGNRYDLVVLDPPSFGHGPKGQRWEIESDLAELLQDVWELVRNETGSRLLLTAHSQQPDRHTISRWMRSMSTDSNVQARRLELQDLQGRSLDAGFVVDLLKKN